MFVRTKKRGDRTYLMIVENRREKDTIKQVVLHSLGRLDILLQSGRLDGMLASLGRLSEKLAVLGDHKSGKSVTTRTKRIGPGLIFERLWEEVGIGCVVRELERERNFEFSLERAIFLTVLNRLFDPGSDRAAEKWKTDYAIRGTGALALHHLYRAMAWLGTPLPKKEQVCATPFAPRCVKDRIEEELFAKRRDLFSGLDIVFFDTTSIYFEGEGGRTLGENGLSKDHRPDLKQMVVGVVLDNDGRPICSEMWPGNTTDVKSLVPIVQRLSRQFSVSNVCVVADRGMISKETIKEIERRRWKYILGVRMRKVKEVKHDVLSRGGRYEEVYPKSPIKKDPSPLKVKEVVIDDADARRAKDGESGEKARRRYVVCQNEDQAVKDRHDREAILAALEDALTHGDKSLIGNKGYRRFVKTGGTRFCIDTRKVKEEERYDGKWVLTTNTDLPAREVALKYKQLWMVEEMFRTMKSLLETRPIYHKCDETIRGHVFCSFLALVLRKELQDRLESKGWSLEWNDIIHDLDNLLEMEITVQDKRYIVRSEITGAEGKVAKACGVALPSVLRSGEPESEG